MPGRRSHLCIRQIGSEAGSWRYQCTLLDPYPRHCSRQGSLHRWLQHKVYLDLCTSPAWTLSRCCTGGESSEAAHLCPRPAHRWAATKPAAAAAAARSPLDASSSPLGAPAVARAALSVDLQISTPSRRGHAGVQWQVCTSQRPTSNTPGDSGPSQTLAATPTVHAVHTYVRAPSPTSVTKLFLEHARKRTCTMNSTRLV